MQNTFNERGESPLAVVSLVTGAMIWGLIWYPYRILRDAGLNGVAASTVSYTIAFLIGLVLFRSALKRAHFSWGLFWLGIAAGGCNIGYVSATLEGEVVRVLLLFYLAPLWTVFLSRLLLGERLGSIGALVITLSLAGAASVLWQPGVGLPMPRGTADWLGLGAGFSFALFNVLSRRERWASIELRSMAGFLGVMGVGAPLMLFGAGWPEVSLPASAWWIAGAIGITLVLANLVVQYGLARVASNRAIVIMLSELAFAAVSAWLLADEAFGWQESVGGVMILAASVLSGRMGRRK